MKVQEIIMRALTGELHPYRTADLPRLLAADGAARARAVRALRARGLLDGRPRRPFANKRAPLAEVTRVVPLYRDQHRLPIADVIRRGPGQCLPEWRAVGMDSRRIDVKA